MAARFGKQHGLFVNSGSSALLLALASLDLKPGDEARSPRRRNGPLPPPPL